MKFKITVLTLFLAGCQVGENLDRFIVDGPFVSSEKSDDKKGDPCSCEKEEEEQVEQSASKSWWFGGR